MLRALEEEHFDQLPGGVFNKGFVRAYARQIGLDEEEALTDYLAALRESQILAQQILPDFRTPGGKPARVAAPEAHSQLPPANVLPSGVKSNGHELPTVDRRKQDRRSDRRHDDTRDAETRDNETRDDEARTPDPARAQRSREDHKKEDHRKRDHAGAAAIDRHLEGSARPRHDVPSTPTGLAENSARSTPSFRIPRNWLAAALLLLTVALAIWNSRRHHATAPQLVSSTSASTSASSPTSPPASTRSDSRKLSQPASATPSVQPAVTPASPGRPAATATAAPTSAKTNPTSSPDRPVANLSTNPAASPALKATAPVATSKPLPTFTLLIRAEQTTWVSIVADGKPVAQETLIAPAHTSVRGSGEIIVKVGNAAGVSFVLNGKEFPARGNEGEVKTYVFDATGFRVPPLLQAPAPNR